MAKRWNYSGDINLEYGGLFWREDGADDYVLAVEVTPCSDAGGPNNLYWVAVGSIYLPKDEERRKSALACIGITTDKPSRWELVEAFRAYHGIERDSMNGDNVVQIGKDEEGHRGFDPITVTHRLRGNASLKRFVRREFLS
jgi:hypothetical protein